MTRAPIVTGLLASAVLAAFVADASAQGAPKPPAPPPPTVAVGQPMPDFSLPYLEPAKDGARPQSKTVKLSELAGKVVVLAFFPAAFSPG